MPVIKSAKKKLRKDKKRQVKNQVLKNALKKMLKDLYKTPSVNNAKKATQIIDKAAKKGIIHRNKANRIKSKLSKFLSKTPKKEKNIKTAKKSSDKAKNK